MVMVKETARGRLLEHDGVQFWIQKRWQRADGTLTPAGKKALAIEAEYRRRNADFDAARLFEVAAETDKALLLMCEVDLGYGERAKAKFWIPRTMARDRRFVTRKLLEVRAGFPFCSARVIWPGEAAGGCNG